MNSYSWVRLIRIGLTPVAILGVFIYHIYEVYGYRGRTVRIWGDESGITLADDYADSPILNTDISYSIKKITGNNFSVEISNRSFSPYFFWLYEYEKLGR